MEARYSRSLICRVDEGNGQQRQLFPYEIHSQSEQMGTQVPCPIVSAKKPIGLAHADAIAAARGYRFPPTVCTRGRLARGGVAVPEHLVAVEPLNMTGCGRVRYDGMAREQEIDRFGFELGATAGAGTR